MPVLIDEVSDTLCYIGIANQGGAVDDEVWEILKLDTSSGLTLTTTLDARHSKIAKWDDRTTYTYG